MCTIQKLTACAITALSQDDECQKKKEKEKVECDSGVLMDYEEACDIEVKLISSPRTSPTNDRLEVGNDDYDVTAGGSVGLSSASSEIQQAPVLNPSPTEGIEGATRLLLSETMVEVVEQEVPFETNPESPTVIEIIEETTQNKNFDANAAPGEEKRPRVRRRKKIIIDSDQSDSSDVDVVAVQETQTTGMVVQDVFRDPTGATTLGEGGGSSAREGSLRWTRKRRKIHQSTNELFSPKKRSNGNPKRTPKRGLRQIDASEVEIFKGATYLGSDKLFDLEGYAYTSQRDKGSKRWRCCVRNRKRWCNAMIKEDYKGRFFRGSVTHNHDPTPGARTATLLTAEVRSAAKAHPSKSPQEIVEAEMEKHIGNDSADKDLKVLREGLIQAVQNVRQNRLARPRFGVPNEKTAPKQKGRPRGLTVALRTPPKIDSKTTKNYAKTKTRRAAKGSESQELSDEVVRLSAKLLRGLIEVDSTQLEIIKGGTRYGSDKLIDVEGYGYTSKMYNGAKIWRCVKRSTKKWCNAYLKEDSDGRFYRGSVVHNHPMRPTAREEAHALAKANCETSPTTGLKKIRNPQAEKGFKEIDLSMVEVVKGVSVRGSDKLFDSDGYAYTSKFYGRGHKMWRCNLRRHDKWCNAMIKEDDEGRFYRGSVTHNHPPKPNARTDALIIADAKLNSVLFPDKTPAEVCRDVINRHCLDGADSYDKLKREGVMITVRTQRKKVGIVPTWQKKRLILEPTKIDSGSIEIIPGGSCRGSDKLVDSAGYSYTSKRKNKCGSRLWRCCLRRTKNWCPATIREDVNGNFETGTRPHGHLPNPKSKGGALAASKARKSTAPRTMKPAKASNGTSKKQTGNGIRSAKSVSHKERLYRKMVEIEPEGVDFKLSGTGVPHGFLQKDIALPSTRLSIDISGPSFTDVSSPGARHMIFATAQQMEWLIKADIWYIDVETQLVKPPFRQLLTIHAFFSGEKEVRQLPLMFCFMSRQESADYVAVLQEIMNLLPATPDVECVVAEFDKNLWEACRNILPFAEVRGCAYHFKEAILRQVRELGLEDRYLDDLEEDGEIIGKIVSLCYLPPYQIGKTLRKLEKHLPPSSEDIERLFQIVKQEWVDGKIWPPVAWSVFNSPIRTCDDVNDWIEKLNQDRNSQPRPFYPLIKILHMSSIATFGDGDVELVPKKKLKKHQKYSDGFQGQIFQYWGEYLDGRSSVRELLEACARLNDSSE